MAPGSSWGVWTALLTLSNQKPKIYTALIQHPSLTHIISDTAEQQTRELLSTLCLETIHQTAAGVQILIFNNDIFQHLQYSPLQSHQSAQLCFTGLHQHYKKMFKMYNPGQQSQQKNEFLFCHFTVLFSLICHILTYCLLQQSSGEKTYFNWNTQPKVKMTDWFLCICKCKEINVEMVLVFLCRDSFTCVKYRSTNTATLHEVHK